MRIAKRMPNKAARIALTYLNPESPRLRTSALFRRLSPENPQTMMLWLDSEAAATFTDTHEDERFVELTMLIWRVGLAGYAGQMSHMAG